MWVYLADRKSHKLVTLPQMVYDLKEEKEVRKDIVVWVGGWVGGR